MSFPISSHRLSAVAALMLLVAACGDDGTTPPPPVTVAPSASISASPTTVPQNDGNNTVVTLDGSGSTDPNGDPLTYQWIAASGTFVNSTPTDSIAQVTFPGAAPYAVTLTVTDPDGNFDIAMTTIGLGPGAPAAPTASISASPTTVPQGDGNTTVVTLDGSGSTDPNGDTLTFSWAVQSGTFVNNTTASDPVAQVTFPGAAPYGVTLTVTDPDGNSDMASTTIGLGP